MRETAPSCHTLLSLTAAKATGLSALNDSVTTGAPTISIVSPSGSLSKVRE
jgi:hypothetical protein